MNDVPSLQQEYPACSFSETPHHSREATRLSSALNKTDFIQLRPAGFPDSFRNEGGFFDYTRLCLEISEIQCDILSHRVDGLVLRRNLNSVFDVRRIDETVAWKNEKRKDNPITR